MRQNGRIVAKFRALRSMRRAALIPFIVAGDPDLETTPSLVRELESRGADLIEIGVPFSDPMADGPTIQRALARGLNAGASLAQILAMIAELRRTSEIPIILFGYFNPILRYGCERFCMEAARAGVDGLLVVDLPPEESAELVGPARAAGLDFVYLLAPTTPIERARRIARVASGFVYYVSVTGVTGARAALESGLEERVRELSQVVHLPVGVGFGISTPDQARDVARFADAVIVGSALVQTIESSASRAEMLARAGNLVASIRDAIQAARPAATHPGL
jgi:tryptophan synthase alpha chain